MDDQLYALDRIEDGRRAVLTGENPATPLIIPVEWLPSEAHEGDLLRASRSKDGVVELRVDRKATEERLEEMRRLRESLPRGQPGDLSL